MLNRFSKVRAFSSKNVFSHARAIKSGYRNGRFFSRGHVASCEQRISKLCGISHHCRVRRWCYTFFSKSRSFILLLSSRVVFPLFIVPASILGFFYRSAAVGYLNTGRDIRRMESTSRSPIFANFNELLEGIVTVRAFSAEQRFLNDLYSKVDLTTQVSCSYIPASAFDLKVIACKMWYTFWMTNRWLLLYFDALGATGVLATTLFALSGYVRAGTAGVCITSAMSFTTSVYWACRFWTALELDLKCASYSSSSRFTCPLMF